MNRTIKKISAMFVALLMIVALIPLMISSVYAADSSTVSVYTDYNGSFGGGQVKVSYSDTTKDWAANGYGNMSIPTGTEVTIYAQADAGYTFSYWKKTDSTGTTNSQFSDQAEYTFTVNAYSDPNLYLYAVFTKDPYTVKFDTRGGNEIDSQEVAEGEKAVQPEDPTKGDSWIDGSFEGWYSNDDLTEPFSFNTPITADITLYAKWNYGLSVGTYNKTTNASDYSCGFFRIDEVMPGDYSGNSNFTIAEGTLKLHAYANNGYIFVGWYEGEYVGGEGQDMKLKEPENLLSANPDYTLTHNSYTCLIPVFEKADVINFVDIGNVWIWLDPLNEIPFTGEVNPNQEGLTDYIELADERWTCGDTTFHIGESGIPTVGNTYKYTAVINAKGDNVFDPAKGFRFIYGGSEYDLNDFTVKYSDDNKTVDMSGFVEDQKVLPFDMSEAEITGLKAKTYTGKAQTQKPVVKLGDMTLVSGTDYQVAYKNNKNVGTATITVTGIGKCTGTVKATFKINKASNPLSVKAKKKTVNVKLNKVSKKAQTYKATQLFTFTKKGQGKITFAKSSGNKKITISKKGKLTIKKGTKKGTYSVKINVKAAGNTNYKAVTKTVTFTVKVK